MRKRVSDTAVSDIKASSVILAIWQHVNYMQQLTDKLIQMLIVSTTKPNSLNVGKKMNLNRF